MSKRQITLLFTLLAFIFIPNPLSAEIPTEKANLLSEVELDNSQAPRSSPKSSPKSNFTLDKLHKLRAIDIDGSQYLSQNSLLKATGLRSFQDEASENATSIFSFSSATIAEELNKLAWVKKAEIEKSYFPPKVKIKLEEEVPWFVLEGTKHNPSWLVGRSGTLLKPLDHIKESGVQYLVSSLPRLHGIWNDQTDSSHFSSTIFSKFRYATKSLRALEAKGGFPFAVSRFRILEEGGIEIEPESFKNARAKKLSIAFDNVDHLPDLLNRYALVRKDLRGKGLVVDKLDLRFKGRVVAVSAM